MKFNSDPRLFNKLVILLHIDKDRVANSERFVRS